MPTVRDEYWVELKGKRHPTYPGVLIAAHEEGLLGIEVQVLQYPAEGNGNTAVCQATVTMKGDGERDLVFTEIGDANSKNCSPMIALANIRMAATRAKGRALRDAIALGVTLAEEIPQDEMEAERYVAPPKTDRPRVRNEGTPETFRQDRAAAQAAERAAPSLGTDPQFQAATQQQLAEYRRLAAERTGSPVAPPPANPATGEVPRCEVCQKPLTTARATISSRVHGRPLCIEHGEALGTQKAKIAASPAV